MKDASNAHSFSKNQPEILRLYFRSHCLQVKNEAKSLGNSRKTAGRRGTSQVEMNAVILRLWTTEIFEEESWLREEHANGDRVTAHFGN